jgi:hypothetical protein
MLGEPALVLKLSLGFILIAAAVGTFGRRSARVRRGKSATPQPARRRAPLHRDQTRR